ncbi:MAG: class I SAM-dependent methyltransferase [bacterium]|nr:class I SAM-dependent methyltransferase [bacterium]
MDLKSTYNRIAEDWYKEHSDDTFGKPMADKFAALLHPGDSVLDVGCGAGTKAKYLTKHGLKVTGIDFSDKLLAIAMREVPESRFILMDMHEVDQLVETFDGIFLSAVLLHEPKDRFRETLGSMLTRLKSGGYVFITLKEKPLGKKDEETEVEHDYGYEYRRFFSYYTSDEIKEHCEALGLEIVSLETVDSGKRNWIFVIAKKT